MAEPVRKARFTGAIDQGRVGDYGPPREMDYAAPAVVLAAPGGPVLTVRLTPLQVEAVRAASEARAAGGPFGFAPTQVVPPAQE